MTELSLEIVEGAGAGRRVALSGPLTVGRARDADLVLADELVSRRHARITSSGSGAIVEDLESRNGTFLNGDEIHGPTHAEPGDQLQLGVTLIELRSAAQVAERPSAVHPVPPPLAVPVRPPDYLPAGDTDDRASTPRPPVGKARRHELDPLLDARTKRQARTAPLALFVLAALVLIIYLATAR